MSTTKLLSLSFFLLFVHFAFAQSFNKMNAALTLELKTYQSQNTLGKIIPVLVKGDLSTIQDFMRSIPSGRYKYGVKNIASIELKAGELFRLNRLPQVERIEFYNDKAFPLNTVVTENNNIDSIRAGFGELPQGYDGEGVIVGMLDLGVEWKHPDFQNEDGSTRILHLWDQNIVDSTNTTYGYGYEWDSIAINAGNITHDPDKYGGHGSISTGIAAGNGLAADTMAGVAPKADIIHVDISFSSFTSNFLDGVQYIVSKAAEHGKPVAMNCSLGSYFGSHDGRELAAEMVDNILDEQNGRFLTQAAGNAGLATMHLGYDITSDTSTTFFKYSAATENVYINLYANKDDFADAHFSIGQITSTTFQRTGATSFFNIPTLSDFADSTYFEVVQDIEDSAGNKLGELYININLYKDVYDITILIDSLNNTTDYWELRTTGAGRLDAWNDEGTIGNSTIIKADIPNPSIFPDSTYYKYPDNLSNTIGKWACSPKVLTVGAYNNRAEYVGSDSLTYSSGLERHAFATYSSRGPTRTGLTKPDVITSGEYVFAPNSLYILDLVGPTLKLFTQYHLRGGGTSAAGPIAQGAGALYLQMHPNADYAEIIAAFQNHAKVDSFTLATQHGDQFPSPDWGYGKLDAFQALQGNLVYGCTDPSADNYNANIDIEDNTLCDYSSSVEDPAFITHFRVQPNPSKGYANIVYQFEIDNIKNADFLIVDILGRTVHQMPIKEKAGIIAIPQEGLAKGMYFCILKLGNQMVSNRKMTVIP